MNIFRQSAFAPLTVAALWLAACASTDPTRVEQDFGNSVRQMVDAQIYDREAAKKPRKDPPMGIDGVQAEAIMESYREHVGNPDEVTDTLRIEVDE